MRQEETNTFNEGLYMDYNPISTPNSVLTDNLNGTFITYDGNELMLQNDMGNYQLKDCQLKPNYIPIGMKEYGNILYIVSYNPLDKHVEIGSFPSPEVKVHLQEEKDADREVDNIVINGLCLFTDLVSSSQPVMWYNEKLKLFPGDQYLIDISEEPNSPYVFNKWFIIDDDKNTYDITDEIHIGPVKEDDDNTYWNVTWENPGYLYTKQEILTPTEFNAYISTIILPNFVNDYDSSSSITASDVDIRFSLVFKKVDLHQIKWLMNSCGNDLLNLSEETLKKIISFDIKCSISNPAEDQQNFSADNIKWNIDNIKIVDYSDSEYYISGVISMNEETSSISGLNSQNTLIFNVTPVVLNEDKSGGIIYNQFVIQLSQNLSNIGSLSDISLGGSIYKFWREEDKLYIEYDVDGPVVVNAKNELFYKIWPLNRYIANVQPIQDWTPFPNYFGLGQNLGYINFDENIKPEEAYIITFGFGEKETSIDPIFETLPQFNRILISSVVFNEFVNSRSIFDLEISFNEWFSLHDKYFKDCNAELKFDTVGASVGNELKTDRVTNNDKFFNTTLDDANDFKYSTAITADQEKPEAKYYFGYDVSNVDCNVSVTNVEIGLWKTGITSITCTYKDNTILLQDSGDNLFTGNQRLTATAYQSCEVTTECIGQASIPTVDKVYCNKGVSLSVTGTNGPESGEFEDVQLVQSLVSTTHNWQINSAYTQTVCPIINDNFAIGASKVYVGAAKINNFSKALGAIVSNGLLDPALVTVMLWTPLVLDVILIGLVRLISNKALTWVVNIVKKFLKWISNVLGRFGDWLIKLGSEKNTTTAIRIYAFNRSNPTSLVKINSSIDSDGNISRSVDEEPDFESIDKTEQICIYDEYVTNAAGNDYVNSKYPTWIQGLISNGVGNWSKDQFRTNRRNDIMMSGSNTVKCDRNKYTCIPTLWTGYTGVATKNSNCVTGTKYKNFTTKSDFETTHSAWMVFLSSISNNTAIYVPCVFNGDSCYYSYVENHNKQNGTPSYPNAQNNWDKACHVSEQTLIGEIEMLMAMQLWNNALFTIPSEGTLETRSFYCPGLPSKLNKTLSIPYMINVSIIYGKFMYNGVDISNFRRLDDYNISQEKVLNTNILTGNTEIIDNNIISLSGDYNIVDNNILDYFESKAGEISNKVGDTMKEIFDLSTAALLMYNNTGEDPVIKEYAIRGKMRGVYNKYQSYVAGDIFDQLEKNNSDLTSTLRMPIVSNKEYAFVKHQYNNDCGLILGLASDVEIDLSRAFAESEQALVADGNALDVKAIWNA